MSPPPPAALRPARNTLDLDAIRAEFPALAQRPHGKRLAFLDSAASAQKPRVVIETVATALTRDYANVHRGVYDLSQRATEAFEGARGTVARFLGAEPDEIVFTRGTTEAINLVAQAWGPANLKPGDRILLTQLEHHANIVPWQMVAGRLGVEVVAAPIDDRGQLILEAWLRLLAPPTRLAAFAHMSNSLGTILPVAEMVAAARAAGVTTLVDGSQAAVHLPVDVRAMGCDFYAITGHKLYGPTGIGALYGRRAVLADMPPWQGGGDMIDRVSFSGTTFREPPQRFEAGTPAIAEAIGLAAALDWLTGFDRAAVQAHEARLLEDATERLSQIPGLTLVGTAAEKGAILSFIVAGAHPHDVGTILDEAGVAVRTGHHCAYPVMDRFGLPATTRASYALYNGTDDTDQLVEALGTVTRLFG